MRFVWWRALTRWGVFVLGALSMVAGLAAMAAGWDRIVVERGWSLFIAGSMAATGGVVTLAIGAVLSRLDHWLAIGEPGAQAEPAAAPSEHPYVRRPEEVFGGAARTAPEEPVEVDHCVKGDTVYVMFSDGSVEMRGAGGARRFASLADLEAQAGGFV
jgi:hypothetical protein